MAYGDFLLKDAKQKQYHHRRKDTQAQSVKRRRGLALAVLPLPAALL